MGDRRPSLIDQMAMAAASQILLKDGVDISSSEESDSEMDLLLGDDPHDHAEHEMIFRTNLPEEANELHDYLEAEEGSDPSQAGSEDLDEFADHPLPMEYQWRPRSSNTLEDSAVSGFDMSSSSDNWGEAADVSQEEQKAQRLSFKQTTRRSSYQSQKSEGSAHSAPARGESVTSPLYGMAEGGSLGAWTERRRPVSIAVPNAEGAGKSRRNSSSIRRSSVKISSVAAGSGNEEDASNSANTRSSSSGGSGLLGFGRRSARRQNSSAHARSCAVGSVGSLDDAIESLRKLDSNSEWENVAAAVTVVAAGNQGTGNSKSRHIKFSVDDTVLVFLTLLNVTNMEDPKDTFTVAPVNKYGYRAGEGRTEAERAGPYTFVLATVKHMHFEEDDRYYTVVRADTGTEQRADSGWIEPLDDPEGIEAASSAAKRTVRSAQDRPIEDVEEPGYLQDAWGCLRDMLSWPADFSRSTLLPWYRQKRSNAKQQATRLLYGDAPFACKVRVTGINFLVICNFIFLFLEVINLAFLPASYDQGITIVGVVVWGILALELVFALLIRPKGYSELIESDKAFAPSTARFISWFHLVFEAIALLTFIPEFRCLADMDFCPSGSAFSRVRASRDAILGMHRADAARGRFVMGITAFRLFGLVRHWKQMFISNTFRPTRREGLEKWFFPNATDSMRLSRVNRSKRRKKEENEDENGSFCGDRDENITKLTSSEEDERLKNAATIGTALMVVNSQRALILLTAIVLLLPLLDALTPQNLVETELVNLLQANNIEARDDCEYLKVAVDSWVKLAAVPQPSSLVSTADTFVLWAQLLPKRCDFQREDGVITSCSSSSINSTRAACKVWDDDYLLEHPSEGLEDYFANELDLRVGGIQKKVLGGIQKRFLMEGYEGNYTTYNVTVVYNENPTVSLANMGLFFLLMGILILGLCGLTALRGEAIRLVLDPLQRMLKIVLRYAENPLSQDVKGVSSTAKKDYDDSALDNDAEEIGNYETEQLINAITKIADLLRKCWGVAGAGIISSNLARTKDGKTVVFNPTVPGKRVYALFGFVAINGFSEQLRALDRDVMILINDVAKVVHDEVYRWALGDHGQCNKNLGAAFLMVFRIGDFSEVHKRKQVATEILFIDNGKNSNKKAANLRQRYTRSSMGRIPYGGRKTSRDQEFDGQLQLASLPGIQAFTDRALLGMLKSFAGIHRDKNLHVWKNDFRLSAGVSAYHVDIIYGMDAGWAVEGAVGSEYKIDATYLSPHVNMASRMMSATKQYGVTILLSKAVEELLSRTCRKKLRHLDTVYVKGSKVKQDIFTFDARHKGVDFFLIERTPEQADLEAESYTPNIWNHDQDLLAMRQHVSDEFQEIFSLAVKQYLAGKWKEAYKNFEKADNKMIETALEDGYLELDLDDLEGSIFDKSDQSEDIVRVRHELGDGACHVLMAYIERRNFQPPDDWDAVRQLSSK